MDQETNEARVDRLVRQYALSAPAGRLDAGLVLRDQLGIESLSLVSLIVRLGDELGVDVIESGIQFGETKTVADLVRVAEMLARK
jgi:acyl carrier protein